MTDDDKALVEVMKDAVLHGRGFIKNGKHIPIDDVYLDPRDARLEALSAENERLRGLLSRTIVMAETYAEGTGTQFNEAMAEARAALEEKK